jgi:tRNA(Leu) C34 or U34 (ribose-2'-O)-methylase TrmL
MKTPGVVLVNPKYPHNLAAAIRACACFGVEDLIYTGSRIDVTPTERLPREERMKGYRAVKWTRSDFPLNGRGTPVCVEVRENSESLRTFEHPDDAIYVFGPEDGSVPQAFRLNCFRFVHIPAHHCLNLAAAVNVVLAHRFMQRMKEPMLLSELLHETRGELSAVGGWDGK